MVVPRVVLIENLPAQWDAIWLLGAAACGLVAAGVWTIVSRRTALEAAIEIDRRFHLYERVASSISLSDGEQNSPAGQAVVKDAVRAASRIDVNDEFRVRLDRRAWLPLAPAALAFLVIAFFGPAVATSGVNPHSPTLVAKQINTAAESARKKLEEQRKRAEREGFKNAAGLFKQIEAGTNELAKKKDIDRTKAAVKLNDLAKQLEQRRQQLGGKDSLRKQLQSLKSFDSGPAEKIAQAMQQGNFQDAAKELEKLASALKDSQLTDEQKAALAKQLEELQQKLADAAEAQQQAMDDLQRQIDEARESGDLAKAGQLQQQLDRLAAQAPQMHRLQFLSDQTGRLCQGLQTDNLMMCDEAMECLCDKLGEMQQDADELAMLDAALDDLQLAKDAMVCPNCQGAGCEQCEGNAATIGLSQSSSRAGNGIGRGRGNGLPGAEPDTETQDVRVRQRPGRGPAVFAGSVNGPNIKGQVEATITQEMATFGKSEADPLATERLPRNRREHAEEYFNQLREGR